MKCRLSTFLKLIASWGATLLKLNYYLPLLSSVPSALVRWGRMWWEFFKIHGSSTIAFFSREFIQTMLLKWVGSESRKISCGKAVNSAVGTNCSSQTFPRAKARILSPNKPPILNTRESMEVASEGEAEQNQALLTEMTEVQKISKNISANIKTQLLPYQRKHFTRKHLRNKPILSEKKRID